MRTPNPSRLDRRLLSCPKNELSIVLGDTALDNLRASLRQASLLASSGTYDSVIYINLPFSRKRFGKEEKEHLTAGRGSVSIHHISSGHLARTVSALGQKITDGSRTAVIINSWEMSSSCYRFREELVFAIQQLLIEQEVTVIVYGQSKPSTVESGKINRTGLGKLAVITDVVINIASDEFAQADDLWNEPAAREEHSAIEVTSDGVFAHLPAREIKDLGGAHGHLSAVALDDMIEEEVDEEDEEEPYHEEYVEEGELEYA